MIISKKAVAAAETIVEFSKEQPARQNCIFRQFGADHWNCQIDAYDLRDTLNNIQAKKRNRGYL